MSRRRVPGDHAVPPVAPAVVLGVDPGLTRCGVGVVAGPPGRPAHRHHDCISTSSDTALEQRLVRIHDGIEAAIASHAPHLVAVERVLFSRNVRTAMATGHAAGAVMLAAARAGLPVVQLTPTDVKASVAGDGGADKDGVARMVVAQLGLARVPRPADAADALAVALAALSRMRTTAAGAASGQAAGVDGVPGPGARTAGATGGAASWERLLAVRGLSVSGGTAAPDARQERP